MILDDKSVLVTGGTGSLGKVLVRRMLSGEAGQPRKVTVLSRDEAKQHEMRLSYLHRRATTDEVIYENFQNALQFRIGDVRDFGDVCHAMRDADIVVNAAALKQVPTCEYFPGQALLTNCMGAMNICRAIHENGYPVQVVVGVSTDKACKPVNVMGMTKALQERIFLSANIHSPGARFVAVRYGNVLASRGSVIPLFHDQIRLGGPVTITHDAMTRFLMSLDQAVDLIFASVRDGRPGETLVPICPSARVVDIAEALIAGRNIETVTTGVRPGEKLHEILISEEEVHRVRRRGDNYVIRPVLPELASPDDAPGGTLDEEYGSASSVVSQDEVTNILRKHQLMVEQRDLALGEEFLR